MDLPHPELERLFALWAEKRGTRLMPARSDIDVSELKDWLGQLVLIEVEPGDKEPAFHYRVYGSVLAEWFERDLTRKTDAALNEGARTSVRREYKQVCAQRQPVLTIRERRVNRQPARVAKLVLPLSDDGETVDRLLVASYVVAR